jgi:hypothetical protein
MEACGVVSSFTGSRWLSYLAVLNLLQADDVWHRIAFQWELATAGVLELLRQHFWVLTLATLAVREVLSLLHAPQQKRYLYIEPAKKAAKDFGTLPARAALPSLSVSMWASTSCTHQIP